MWFCDSLGISSNSILAVNSGTELTSLSSLYENYIKNYEITGESKFTCVELEVYKVETFP